eukprot:5256793-Prymnesium_polylepis.1
MLRWGALLGRGGGAEEAEEEEEAPQGEPPTHFDGVGAYQEFMEPLLLLELREELVKGIEEGKGPPHRREPLRTTPHERGEPSEGSARERHGRASEGSKAGGGLGQSARARRRRRARTTQPPRTRASMPRAPA